MKKLNIHFVNAQLVPFSMQICKRLLQGQPTSPSDIWSLYQNATTSEGRNSNKKSATVTVFKIRSLAPHPQDMYGHSVTESALALCPEWKLQRKVPVNKACILKQKGIGKSATMKMRLLLRSFPGKF